MLKIFYMDSDQLGDGLGVTGSRRVEITGRGQLNNALDTADSVEKYFRETLERQGWRFYNFNFQVNDPWKLMYMSFDIYIAAEVLNQYSDQQIADSLSRELENQVYATGSQVLTNVALSVKSPNAQQPSTVGINNSDKGSTGDGGNEDDDLFTKLFGKAGTATLAVSAVLIGIVLFKR